MGLVIINDTMAYFSGVSFGRRFYKVQYHSNAMSLRIVTSLCSVAVSAARVIVHTVEIFSADVCRRYFVCVLYV